MDDDRGNDHDEHESGNEGARHRAEGECCTSLEKDIHVEAAVEQKER
jgi:hypothetical protein